VSAGSVEYFEKRQNSCPYRNQTACLRRSCPFPYHFIDCNNVTTTNWLTFKFCPCTRTVTRAVGFNILVGRASDDRTAKKVFMGKPDGRRKEGRPKLG
jgi:hypothetical protein